MSELLAALGRPTSATLDHIRLPVGVADASGRTVYANPAYGDLFGVPASALVGRAFGGFDREQRERIQRASARWSRGEVTFLSLSTRRAGEPEPEAFLALTAPILGGGKLFALAHMMLRRSSAEEAIRDHLESTTALVRSMLGVVAEDAEVLRALPPPTLEELRAVVPGLATLSGRELEVTRLLTEGARPADVASELGIRPNTVRNHLKAIFRKLRVHDQATLVATLRHGSGEGAPR